MTVRKSGSRVLWYECVGFTFIILLCWINQTADLPLYLVGGSAHAPDLRVSTVETLIVLGVWLFVFHYTRRLLDRLYYLEGMLRVCAWCRRIGHEHEWMRIEDYFSKGFHIESTHGMCPECFAKFVQKNAPSARSEGKEATPPDAQPQAA